MRRWPRGTPDASRRWPWHRVSRRLPSRRSGTGCRGGTYARLVMTGAVHVAEGLRVQPPGQLVDAILENWGKPEKIVADRFRQAELPEAVPRGVDVGARGDQVERRGGRYSGAAQDGLRWAADVREREPANVILPLPRPILRASSSGCENAPLNESFFPRVGRGERAGRKNGPERASGVKYRREGAGLGCGLSITHH